MRFIPSEVFPGIFCKLKTPLPIIKKRTLNVCRQIWGSSYLFVNAGDVRFELEYFDLQGWISEKQVFFHFIFTFI
jgi:hypothetical protein